RRAGWTMMRICISKENRPSPNGPRGGAGWSGHSHAWGAGRATVSRVLTQRGIGVDLRLGNRPPLLVLVGQRLRVGRGLVEVRIVRDETALPVSRLLRVAPHQIEPALGFEGELPGALHEDGIAHRQLVHRFAGRTVVMRLGAGLGAGALAGAGADHVQVLHGDAGIAELVLR